MDLFNMGHAAFFAIGAYTTAILSSQDGVPLIWLFPLGGLVATAFAYVVTRPIIHLRGDYLLIVTIGLNEIVRIALINNPWSLTGGPNGLLVLDRFRIGGWSAAMVLMMIFRPQGLWPSRRRVRELAGAQAVGDGDPGAGAPGGTTSAVEDWTFKWTEAPS